jgi:cystathionine beta-synthase
VMAAEVAGAVSERTLMDALYSGKARLADMVEQHMDAALPSLGAGEPVTKAVELLEGRDALMVLDDGKPVGVLTRQDLLVHLSAD